MGCFFRKSVAPSFFFLKKREELYLTCRSCEDNLSKVFYLRFFLLYIRFYFNVIKLTNYFFTIKKASKFLPLS